MDVPNSTSDAPRFRTSINWLRAVLLASVIAATLTFVARVTDLPDVFRAPDAWTYDWRTAHFSPRVAKPRADIVIVLIDDESLDGYASQSPVDRGLQAKLVTGLEAAGAKAVGLDFIYDRPGEPEADKALFSSLSAAKVPFILGTLDGRSPRFTEKHRTHQDGFLADVGKEGSHLYFAHKQDRLTLGDQVVRYWLGPSQDAPHRKGLAHALAEAAGHKPKQQVFDAQLIDWQRPPELGDFAYPFRTLRVRAHEPGSLISDLFWPGWESLVRGKIVLVGGDFIDRDRHLTPFSVIDGASMPGVMVHAQILAQILDGREVVTLPAWAEAALRGRRGFEPGSEHEP